MPRIQFLLPAAILLAVVSGSAIAQAPADKAAPAASAPDSKPTTVEQVETWTRKEWNAAKKEWAKDKAKWADCEKQSSDQKLKGRKSWSFLYACMKTS